ncbi:MAG: hypothetical protein ACI4VE_03915 [Clostridia bacterium]
MIQENNDVYKEVFTTLSFFSDDLIDKIPSNVLEAIGNLSLNSNANLYIDKEKSLKSQDISEDSKNLISLIYYTYIANENEKNELLKLWNENENKYQEQLRKEYNLDNLFQHQRKENTVAKSISVFDTAMVEYRKETLFFKVKNFIKRIFK